MPKITKTTNYLQLLLTGAPGSGKSAFAASACQVEKLGRVLVLDCGNSYGTYFGVPGFESLTDVYQVTNLIELIELVNEHVRVKDSKFDTVIVDEVNRLYGYGASQYLNTPSIKKAPKRTIIDFGGGFESIQMFMGDWRSTHDIFQQITDELISLPINLIMCCLAGRYEEESTGRPFIGVSLPGKAAGWLQSRFNNYWHLEVDTNRKTKEVNYKVHFTPSGIIQARTRGLNLVKTLGNSAQNITLNDVYYKLYGDSNE